MASEGAGRSFNRTIALRGATLETVVRLVDQSPLRLFRFGKKNGMMTLPERLKKIASSEISELLRPKF